MRRRIVIDWSPSSFFGWGVYGLNLGLAWARDAELDPVYAATFAPAEIVLDPPRRQVLEPVLAASAAFQRELVPHAGGELVLDGPLLAGVGASFQVARSAHQVGLRSQRSAAVAFFETGRLSPEALARAAMFQLVVAGSSWNAQVLRDHGLARVRTVLQGIDPTLFHPAPSAGIMADRFLVFSGGKLELRKGQDITLAAFRIFAARHPDAVLVTAWRSPWPAAARSLDASPLTRPMAFDARGQVDVRAWALANGVAAGQVMDLGHMPNADLPKVLREVDVAVFPNRCEGGTNLAAMECMACGAPTILSRNTGHLDLIADDNCYALDRQGEAPGGEPGWGESDVEEVVAALERAYADRDDARRRGARGAETLAAMTWARTAAAMKEIALAL